MNTRDLKEFDAAEYLDSPEMISAYLQMVLEEGTSEELQSAIGDVAKAVGMSVVARKSGLGRESLYKALNANAKPRWETIVKVLKALELKIQIAPA